MGLCQHMPESNGAVRTLSVVPFQFAHESISIITITQVRVTGYLFLEFILDPS